MKLKKRTSFYKKAFTILSFLGIIFWGIDIDFGNIKNIIISFEEIRNILYDISIGIFSAMILVWGIDEVNERIRNEEEKKRYNFVYRKLIPILNEYYEFYLKLYIFTRKDKVKEDEKILNSIYACKDEFIKQIMETEPFYKAGFYADINIVNLQIIAMTNNAENLDEIMQKETGIPWYKCWTHDSTEFYNNVEQIEKMFLDFFPNDLIVKLDQLLELIKVTKNMSDFIEQKTMRASGMFIPSQLGSDILKFPIEFFLEGNNLIKIIEILEEIMEYIERETGEMLRQRDIKFFNDRNTSPTLGGAYKLK